MQTLRKLTCLVFAFAATLAYAQVKSLAQWQEENQDKLGAVNESFLAEALLPGSATVPALLAEVKTGGQSDPLVLTKIAALTQRAITKAPSKQRKLYADALLKAASNAREGDVVCFFLDQLRWCGLPEQAAAIQGFAQSPLAGVAELAEITTRTVVEDRRMETSVESPRNRYAEYNRSLAAMRVKPRMAALLKGFDDADKRVNGIAMSWARSTGGRTETAAWSSKLPTTSGAKKIMLLDMLGARGDKRAFDAIISCAGDDDKEVATAALRALVKLDTSRFFTKLPELLAQWPETHMVLMTETLRGLPNDSLIKPMVAHYDSFNKTGQRIALVLLAERRASAAIPVGMHAIASSESVVVVLGWRLLKEVAGVAESAPMLAAMLAAPETSLAEAQSAFAAAARRDKTNTFVDQLAKALDNATDAQKPMLLATAARIGDAQLLARVKSAMTAADANLSMAAARAITEWADDSVLPELLRLAVAGPDKRTQVLALRSATKRLEADKVLKNTHQQKWREIRGLAGNEEHKTALDALLK